MGQQCRAVPKIYLTYGSVPELAALPLARRNEVLRASGGRFGKTPQFMRVWWLGVTLSFVVPSVVGAMVFLLIGSLTAALYSAVGVGLAGYTAWFHVRTSCLRPHIRAYLSEDERIQT